MKNQKKPSVYAFIDSQNLNLGTNNDIYKGKKRIYVGWRLDFKKFRKYLYDKFGVTKAFLFVGYLPQNNKLYTHLKACGYELVFKPTIKDGKGGIKGNVDAELIVWTLKNVYEKMCDKVVIISGDGDYAVLANFLLEKNKLLKYIIPNKISMSILIKRVFIKKQQMSLLQYLNDEKEKLAIK